MTAIEYLQALQEEVGARRAGTEGERRAQEWLQARCQELALPTELDAFTFIGRESYRPWLQLASVTWLLACITLFFLDQWPLGAAGIALMFYYLGSVHKRVEMRLARTPSYNVIAGLDRPFSAYAADVDQEPAILLCAHYDTPRNQPGWYQRVRNLARFLGPLSLLGGVVYGAYLVLGLIGGLVAQLGWDGLQTLLGPLGAWVGGIALAMTLPGLALMILGSLTALLCKRSDSPGADDNGSGTVLVLEVARRLRARPPENLAVFFAWWGAEERGLFGSRQFVRRFHNRLDKDQFYLVNADCVGVGELLTIHTGQGVFRRRATDPATRERIERAAAQVGARTIRSWESIISGGSSDHADWVDRGFRQTVSLLRENPRPPSLPARLLAGVLRLPDANQLELNHIHTPDDILAGIKPHILAQTVDVAEAYLRALDDELGPPRDPLSFASSP